MQISLLFLLCLLMIPFSFLISKINNSYIKKEKVGFWWHNVQFFSLFLLGYSILLLIFKDLEVALSYTLQLSLTHWIMFDIFLNILRGLDMNYIGHTSMIDKTVRKWGSGLSEANLRNAFLGFKIIVWFTSLVILSHCFDLTWIDL
jgi:hypothetical protein